MGEDEPAGDWLTTSSGLLVALSVRDGGAAAVLAGDAAATPRAMAGAALMRSGIEAASGEMLGGEETAERVWGLAARPIRKKQAKTAAASEATMIIPEASMLRG